MAHDLPTEKFGPTKKKIETKYDEIERSLIEEFAMAQKEQNIEKMKELAKIMSQFKGYSQCVDVYIEQSQAVSSIKNRVYFNILTLFSSKDKLHSRKRCF